MSAPVRLAALLALSASFLAGSAASAQDSRPAGEARTPIASRGGLVFEGHEEWRQHPPTNRMRVVSYTLPGQEGAEEAELVVFYFGAQQGGSTEANLKRWYAQFRQPDGGSTEEAAKVEKIQVAGMKVTLVDVAGTYVAETRPGSGKRVDRPDQRMLAAIVEAPGGPHYLKLVGPAKTAERWAKAFRKFVEGIRLQG